MLWAACFVQYLQRHIVSCSFIPPGGLPAVDGIEHCIAWHSIAQHKFDRNEHSAHSTPSLYPDRYAHSYAV